MKIYLVGGAVRDKMLGRPIKERDFVVVGATVSQMLAAGYKKVGKEFPVFLHPKTREEYALARMERKVGAGYTGFTFDTSESVTLEEDLIRRDLTINAMAEDQETGDIIDPYHGKADLENKILRHVSPAFAEDPVRILRIGRFLARYYSLGFRVAPETIELMKKMVQAGEVNALVAERVWKEWERALGEKNPEQFFAVLADANALGILFPEIKIGSAGLKALVKAAESGTENEVRFAALLHDQPLENVTALCDRYRAPNDYRELAKITAYNYATCLSEMNAEILLDVFAKVDIYRRMPRFVLFVKALKAIAEVENIPFNDTKLVECAIKLRDASNAFAKELIAKGTPPSDIAAKLNEMRLAFLKKY